MCSILGPALVERIQGLHERMDDLLDSHRSKDRELSTLKLSSSWLSDEMERCRSMIEQALRGREAMMPKPGPDGMKPLISDLLAVLLDVQKPTPPTQVHEGRRRDRTAADVVEPQRQQAATQAVPVTGPTDDLASLRRVLHEVLAGEASSGKLNRALGGSDLDLAKRLADLAAEHRTYRLTLRRIGLLPPE
jgi:hypothetical protein